MIPQEKSEAVNRALREAFGVTAFEDIQRLTRGRSPGVFVFRIVVGGRPFLLRVIMRTDDATRHFKCMKAAAEAGLAPHVWYTSLEDRISITDFVESVPFPATDALVRMPATLRALHALPPFARVEHHLNTSCMFLINQGTALDEFIQRVKAAKILPESESEELFARYAQVAQASRSVPTESHLANRTVYEGQLSLEGSDPRFRLLEIWSGTKRVLASAARTEVE